MGAKRKSYTPQYRVDAARLVIDSGRSIAQVSRQIGVGEQLLGRWVAAERARMDDPPPAVDLDERAELERLRVENAALVTGQAARRRPSPATARGFDEDFLAHRVPLPVLSPAIADDALVVDGSPVLDYTHFSLTMSRSRRSARWVAWNVDGSALRRLPRSGMRFRPDPRIPADAQVGDDLYTGNRLDRGHIARRADLTWGDPRAAAAANSDSFWS